MLLLLLLAGAQAQPAEAAARSFTIEGDAFVRDGTPVPLLSGSLHCKSTSHPPLLGIYSSILTYCFGLQTPAYTPPTGRIAWLGCTPSG